ncbi:NAD-dependent DNA ligase LigA [Candidatus Pelagibacter sp.]|nr:NAD-dependent DNA ligase LigA [Candidatus Pelagibacter sp.]|tara:strand:+ start:3538 stop:5559 length:2022 start_codon:yes stop_codon:yes gene_type:complete
MKNRNLIKKEYHTKIKELKEHNQHYYEKSSPKISDSTYDDLKKEITELEKKYSFLKSKSSPSLIVGAKPSKNFLKSKHRIRMLSLSNAFSYEDLKNFEKKISNFLNLKNNSIIEYSVEPKIDGISASLTYKNNNFILGLSRGDGAEGEIITENLKTIKDIPKIIKNKNFPKDIDIRGEVYIGKEDFEKIKDRFANPRNAASGSLRQKDPVETKKIPLRFIAYTYGFNSKINFKKQSEFLNLLKNWGFNTNDHNQVISGIDKLVSNHKELENKRHDLDFDVDGLVYKINDLGLQKRLGYVANAPRWAIAHKFSADSSYSKILNIDIQIGRTGALTPVAKIKPVNIGGVVVSNATLHNEEEIIRKDIRIGDIVKVERAGDVIPHVLSVDLKKRTIESKKFIFPQVCPSCGSKVVKDFNKISKKYDAVKRCSSEGYKCEKIAIEKIKHFVSKEAFNIEGLGKKVVEKFWELKFIKLPFDIFDLNYKKIEKLEGWGELSANNLKKSIEKSKNIGLDKFIFSLGIRHIGQENARLLSQHFLNIKNFNNLAKNFNFKTLANLDGIGETQINSLKNFFSDQINLNVVKKLISILNIRSVSQNTKGKLINKTFMFTGKLSNISRAEAKSLTEENSGKILSNVSKKLDYLVMGDKPTTKKIKQAKELNIKVIGQAEWKKLLN